MCRKRSRTSREPCVGSCPLSANTKIHSATFATRHIDARRATRERERERDATRNNVDGDVDVIARDARDVDERTNERTIVEPTPGAMSGRERDALLGNDAERARRKTAIEGVERSSANADRLEQTARTAMESAQTGENIMSKLHDQREKILSARASAGHMERDMDKSEKRMTQLGCEKCMQRWAFCVLVLLVLTGLSFLLWYKLKHRDEDKARREAEEDEALAMLASKVTSTVNDSLAHMGRVPRRLLGTR